MAKTVIDNSGKWEYYGESYGRNFTAEDFKFNIGELIELKHGFLDVLHLPPRIGKILQRSFSYRCGEEIIFYVIEMNCGGITGASEDGIQAAPTIPWEELRIERLKQQADGYRRIKLQAGELNG